ncbi:MAG: hypothetical protein ACRCZO_19250 [Cetobacterium sp.]
MEDKKSKDGLDERYTFRTNEQDKKAIQILLLQLGGKNISKSEIIRKALENLWEVEQGRE